MSSPRPPRIATALLRLLLPRDEREFLLGDLEERWRERIEGREGASSGAAGHVRLWYYGQVLRSMVHALRMRRESRGLARGDAGSLKPSWNPLRDAGQDLHFALRSFRARPGFALTAVLLIGLGIGATVSIFSVVDAIVLRPLPYPDPDRLVFFDNRPHSFPDFAEWRENLTSVSAIGALTNAEGSVSGDQGPEHVRISHVTVDFLPMLGGVPHLGRLFNDEDHQRGSSVVVLGHGYWQQSWGSDPGVVGRQIQLDSRVAEVVGVLSPGYTPPQAVTASSQVDVWVLLDESGGTYDNRNYRTFGVVARLQDGVSMEAAQSEVDALTAALAQEFPAFFTRADGTMLSFPLVPLQEATVRQVSGVLFLVMGAVGLMLLIACANVANLFLARGTARTGEIALRGALGAGRGRIARQLLTESGSIALVGGGLGVVLAYLGVEFFIGYVPSDLPLLARVSVDQRILLFALAASVGTGVLCGVFPVFQALRRSVTRDLRETTANATTGRDRRRVRSGLVVTELALTVVLLTGAGLLFRSLVERLQVDPGFRTDDLVIVPLDVASAYNSEDRAHFVRDLRERIEGLPGTESVAAGWTLPFALPPRVCCWASRVLPEGWTGGTDVPATFIHPVTPGYFETLGNQMAYGREFLEDDMEADDAPQVVIVNARTARRLFGTEDAVGRRLVIGTMDPFEVVGVERGVHHWRLEEDVDEAVYLPYGRYGSGFAMLHVMVRSDIPVQLLAPRLRDVVQELDPDMATDQIISMGQLVTRSLAGPRFLSVLFGVFAGLALLLASGGIYASMLYTVGQRRREMGIRLALGADARWVTGMVLRDGATLTVLGLAVGVGGAMALSRLMESLLWGVSTTDALTYTSVCILLGAAALAACWLPARRATRSDLVETLKVE
jgi:predicted permease